MKGQFKRLRPYVFILCIKFLLNLIINNLHTTFNIVESIVCAYVICNGSVFTVNTFELIVGKLKMYEVLKHSMKY